jgi:AcrR family transcriptional regulator
MPLPDHEVRDPRIKRTRQLLQNSLRDLLRQKPLEEILVNDVTSAATVNRATFYDHYSSKHDLFNALIAADFAALLAHRAVCFARGNAAGLHALALAAAAFLTRLQQDHAACTGHPSTGPFIDAALTLAIQQILALRFAERPEGALDAALVSGALYQGVKETLVQTNWQADEAALQAMVRRLLPLAKRR